MNYAKLPYRIFSLGDSAITVDFSNVINEAINNEVIARYKELKNDPLPGMIEAIPSYSSLTIYYDVVKMRKTLPAGHTAFEVIKQQLELRLQQPVQQKNEPERLIRIPVCYDEEYAPDMQQLTAKKNISAEEVIQIHTSKTYKVHMLGFLPGFAYMAELDERIVMPRKPQPVNIIAGSVGIAGKQTGIYPLASPGGWHIIGRTPLKLFDAGKEEPTLLRAGDRVQFYSITKDELKSY
ncbi:MAG: 5-oxoprolinase subunit PxpB [Chitinophagaceae bacterium]